MEEILTKMEAFEGSLEDARVEEHATLLEEKQKILVNMIKHNASKTDIMKEQEVQQQASQ